MADNYAEVANNAASLSIIKQYELFMFPYGTDGFTAPTGIDWALPEGAQPLGYSSDDGAVLHPEPGDDTDITAHNGDIVYSESAPGFWTFQFPGIEMNQRSVEAYFDTELAPDGSVTVTKASASRKWIAVIRAIDQDDHKILIYVPSSKVSDRDDLTFIYNAQLTPNFTLKFAKDSATGIMFRAWGLAKDFTPATPAPTLKSIAVAPASGTATSVAVDATLQLKATATYSDNSTKDVSSTAAWASDTTDDATVDNKGLATGKKEGSANITAKVDDVTSPNFKLTVTAAS